MGWDVVMSSGYLAFSRQTGFLAGLEASGVRVDALCGTSSGALAGALWSAGLSAKDIAAEFRRTRPLQLMAPNWTFWHGPAVFRIDPLIARLHQLLPPRFEDLPRPFAVGVIDRNRKFRLLNSGPLPEAVAASCAIPWMFAPVKVGDEWLQDGGVVSRTGIELWRQFRGERSTLVHLVERSSRGAEGDLSGLPVLRSPRAKAGLTSLGDFVGECEAVRAAATAFFQTLGDRGRS